MDVPDSTPLWPSASGPNVPDFDSVKLRKSNKLDMDTALAWLRRELVSIFCLILQFIRLYHKLSCS